MKEIITEMQRLKELAGLKELAPVNNPIKSTEAPNKKQEDPTQNSQVTTIEKKISAARKDFEGVKSKAVFQELMGILDNFASKVPATDKKMVYTALATKYSKAESPKL